MGRILARGDHGPAVRELQAALNFHVRAPATPLAPDGRFGPLTDARVRAFQRAARIDVDGRVGPATIRALYRQIAGAVEAVLAPRRGVPVARGVPRATAAPRALRAAPFGATPRAAPRAPTIPDFVPPSRRTPVVRAATSEGFDVESKLTFGPLDDGEDGEHPLRLTLSPSLPWPVFLPLPGRLELETTAPGVGRFQLDGKLKVPFRAIETRRLELEPYFVAGAGVDPNHFRGLNAGAGSTVKIKLLEDIAHSGVGLSLEADGGAKFEWDRATGDGRVKGFFEGGFVLEKRF